MKRFLKYFLIGALSLAIILCAAIGILCWVVFTPEKITPVIRSQAKKFVACQTEVERVELTFFSTFPYFALKADGMALVNPVPGAPSDTLFSAAELTGRVDVEAWWKRNELIVSLVSLKNGRVNIYTDSLGRANYDIVAGEEVQDETSDEEPVFTSIDISDIELKNLDISYVDEPLKLKTHIRNLNGKVAATMNADSLWGLVEIDRSRVSLEYEGERYLDDAAVQLSAPASLVFSPQSLVLKETALVVNNLKIIAAGSILSGPSAGTIATDLSYRLDEWKIDEALALVPSPFAAYLSGVHADGVVSSSGTIRGAYGDSVMPAVDVHLSIKDGSIRYDGFPLPAKSVEADVRICFDFTTDSLSFVQIERFLAKTPASSFEAWGKMTNLLTDVRCDLTARADLTLDEWNAAIPDSLKTELKGRLKGGVKSSFSLSQLETMSLDKIRMAGSLVLSDFYAAYDTIVAQTGYSEIDFALPNPNAPWGGPRFALLKIAADYLAAKQERGFDANVRNPHVALEISDFRDMSRLPDMVLEFKVDSLSAGMDTIRMAMEKPAGKMSISGNRNKKKSPEIALAYQSEKLETSVGQNAISIHKLRFDTEALNDSAQSEFLLQWLAKGFVDMEKGVISSSSFAYPVEIPSIAMDFSPEELNIRDSWMRIGDSDFRLSGSIKNVFSYLRGDSLLRGDLVFRSDKTDIAQLMSLTNGMNNEGEELNKSESGSSGPYMVPKGVDILLRADVSSASYEDAVIKNIKGNLRIKDGILALEDIVCENSAAKMQLTAMYRTPRKNHLHLFLDYHLLDVEIEELLRMIPEIDSLMPMLNSFRGKGEFHFVVETNLDSLYNIKLSTLIGAASVSGSDLVLLDGETFSEIAKRLNFNKKTENKVDSLSAEFTVYREEIDVYPFQIVMDKYKAVIEGRHNFDLSFNYHISVVDSPLPLKLGVNVKGTIDDFEYSLTKPKYPDFYRPVARKIVDTKRLEMRKAIRESLLRGFAE